jgi:ATP-dependent Zn protease
MTADPRSICAECGHVRSWHDREAARKAGSTESGVDRPCYREVGGAPCLCKGFRDSGDVAVAAVVARRPTSLFRNGLLTLLLVVLGIGLLYAYRSQTPAIHSVAFSQAVQDVNAGQVKKVTIAATRATLELANGDKEQAALPAGDEVFVKAVIAYNSANPSRQIAIEYQQESATFSVVGSIVLGLLPVVLLGGFFYYMMRQATRR